MSKISINDLKSRLDEIGIIYHHDCKIGSCKPRSLSPSDSGYQFSVSDFVDDISNSDEFFLEKK